jgi:hypothetical protein
MRSSYEYMNYLQVVQVFVRSSAVSIYNCARHSRECIAYALLRCDEYFGADLARSGLVDEARQHDHLQEDAQSERGTLTGFQG